LPACFNHLNAIFEEFMAEYVAWKRKRYPVSPPDLRESRANR
jgi:hypothetical protein